MRAVLLGLFLLLGFAAIAPVQAQTQTPAAVNGCIYLSGTITLANGQRSSFLCDVNGKLLTSGGGAPSTITIPTTTTGCATANGVFFNSGNTIACAPSVVLTGAGGGVSAVNEFLINSAGAAPFRVVNRSRLYSPADGVWRMSNNADTGFTSLNFGLLTTAWPMLKIVGPTIQVRLGDDSGAAALTASTLSTAGFTVGTLPAGTVGMRAYVTDQLTACVATGDALVGGGAVVCPAFYNGSAWVGG